jgi:hypothetical protein
MSHYLLAAFGLPVMALTFFAVMEAAFSRTGLWLALSEAGLDLCRVSLGIVGAMFIDAQLRTAPAAFAATVLLLDLILIALAMLVGNRAADMGITRQSTRAFGVVAFGILSVVIPAVLIVLYGAPDGK